MRPEEGAAFSEHHQRQSKNDSQKYQPKVDRDGGGVSGRGRGRGVDDGTLDRDGTDELEAAVGDAKVGRRRRQRSAASAAGVLAHSSMDRAVVVAIDSHVQGGADGGDLLAEGEIGLERDVLDLTLASGVHVGREGDLTSSGDRRRSRRFGGDRGGGNGSRGVVVARDGHGQLGGGENAIRLSPGGRGGGREGCAGAVTVARGDGAELSTGGSLRVTVGEGVDTAAVDLLAASRAVGEGTKEHGGAAGGTELGGPIDRSNDSLRDRGDGDGRNGGNRGDGGDGDGRGSLRGRNLGLTNGSTSHRESGRCSGVNATRDGPRGSGRCITVSCPRHAVEAVAVGTGDTEGVSSLLAIIVASRHVVTSGATRADVLSFSQANARRVDFTAHINGGDGVATAGGGGGGERHDCGDDGVVSGGSSRRNWCSRGNGRGRSGHRSRHRRRSRRDGGRR